MSISSQDKQNMLRAKELIQKKEFRRAFKLIEHIDHPTAEKWRNQLESRIHEDDFGDPFTETSSKSIKLESREAKNNPKGRKRLYIAIGIIVAILITMMAAASNSYERVVQEATQLKVYPSVNSEAVNVDGSQWDFDGDSIAVGTIAFSSASDALSTPTLSDVSLHATTLSVLCGEDGYSVGLVGDSTLKRVDNLHVVAIKFDDDEVQEITMYPTKSNIVAFFRDEDLPALFDELSESGEMWITMPTLSGQYRHSIYDVSGFSKAVRQLEKDCGALPSAS